MTDEIGLDYETFSEVDLTKVGGHNYAVHPSTEILMAAWRLNGVMQDQWIPAEGQEPPKQLLEAMTDPEVEKWAWNAPFEMMITKHVWGLPVMLNQWRDTMVLGHYCSLPGKLEKAGPAIGIPDELCKNPAGKRLMKKFSMMQTSRKKADLGRQFRIHWYEDLPSWEGYLEYNRDDVIAEGMILDKLRKHQMPYFEWQNWWIDMQINQAGLPINRAMVDNAVELFDEAYDRGFTEMQQVTGLSNPMSTQQLLPWLKENGYMFDDCKKGHIKQAYNYFDKKPDHWDDEDHLGYQQFTDLKRVIELRLECSRSSIKKFHALQPAICEDGVLRGSLQFMGAARTGRWSGRVFQPQNLPRPEKRFEKGIEIHAKNVERLDLESIDLIYDNPFDLLASCIRPAAQAPEGFLFADADLNAIENRVLGWLAGCDKILRVFEQGRDPYIDFATYLFDRTYDDLWHEYKVLGNSACRTIAKPGVLGCLKGDTPVLTDKGWKAVIEVREDDWLWDGQKWVTHEGVIFKGHQNVLSRSGLHATPDHKFLTESGWVQWQQAFQQPMFESVLGMANGAFLATQDRHGQQERNLFADVNVVENEKYRDRTLLEGYPHVAPDVLLGVVAPTSEKGSAQSFSTFSQIVSTLQERVAKTQRTVLTYITEDAEYLCDSLPATSSWSTLPIPFKRTVGWKSTGLTTMGTTSAETYGSQPAQSKTEIADTWDILNTGDYARFVVLTEDGPAISHNCGYMLGPGKTYEDKATGEIEATGLLGYAWDMYVKHFTLADSKLSVKTFRREFKEVKDYWYAIERAAIKSVKTRTVQGCGHVEFDMKGDFLRMRLPSGRHLHYYKPEMRKTKMPWKNDDGTPAYKMSLTYEGLDKQQWKRMSTHPGKLTENADQAISRDLLMHGIRKAKKEAGLDVRLHVHDQILPLVREENAEADLIVLQQCMEDQPVWAKGLPLGSDGFTATVFKKD